VSDTKGVPVVESGDRLQHVSKSKVRVFAMVDGWRIEGDLHVLDGSRLTDAINSKTKDFLAVTDATIFDATTSTLLFETPFLALNRDSISMIFLSE
jgi:hypothetical protein